MLFNATINELDNNIATINDNIAALEQQLAELREQKAQAEQHKQKLLTAESAAESALQQLGKAIALIRTVDENQLEALQDAANGLFCNAAIAELEPTTEVIKVDAPLGDIEETIDIEEFEEDTPSEEEIFDSLSDTLAECTHAELKVLSKYCIEQGWGQIKLNQSKFNLRIDLEDILIDIARNENLFNKFVKEVEKLRKA